MDQWKCLWITWWITRFAKVFETRASACRCLTPTPPAAGLAGLPFGAFLTSLLPSLLYLLSLSLLSLLSLLSWGPLFLLGVKESLSSSLTGALEPCQAESLGSLWAWGSSLLSSRWRTWAERQRCSCLSWHLERWPPRAAATRKSLPHPQHRKCGWQVCDSGSNFTHRAFLELRSKQSSLVMPGSASPSKKKSPARQSAAPSGRPAISSAYSSQSGRSSLTAGFSPRSSCFLGLASSLLMFISSNCRFFLAVRTREADPDPGERCSSFPSSFGSSLPLERMLGSMWSFSKWTKGSGRSGARSGLLEELLLRSGSGSGLGCWRSGVRWPWAKRSWRWKGSASSSSRECGCCLGYLALWGLRQIMESDSSESGCINILLLSMAAELIELINFIISIAFLLMRPREGSPARRHTQRSPREQSTQQCLREILRNIETIQSTILRKLDSTSEREKPTRSPSTKHSAPKPHSQRAPHTPRAQRCHTSREHATPPKLAMQITPFFLVKPPEPSENVLRRLNATLHACAPAAIKYSSARDKQLQSHSIKKQIQSMAQSQCPEDKENTYLIKTEKPEKATSKAKQACEPATPKRNQEERTLRHQMRRKYEIGQAQQGFEAAGKGEVGIEEYYRRQIERLEVQERIRQLEEELEDCLYNKRASKPAEFSFIRARMKRISLQLNQLKHHRQALRQ